MTKVEEVKLGTLELAITCMLAETTSHPLQFGHMEDDSFIMTLKGMGTSLYYRAVLNRGDCVSAGLCQVRKVGVDYRECTDKRLKDTGESLDQFCRDESTIRRSSK